MFSELYELLFCKFKFPKLLPPNCTETIYNKFSVNNVRAWVTGNWLSLLTWLHGSECRKYPIMQPASVNHPSSRRSHFAFATSDIRRILHVQHYCNSIVHCLLISFHYPDILPKYKLFRIKLQIQRKSDANIFVIKINISKQLRVALCGNDFGIKTLAGWVLVSTKCNLFEIKLQHDATNHYQEKFQTYFLLSTWYIIIWMDFKYFALLLDLFTVLRWLIIRSSEKA